MKQVPVQWKPVGVTSPVGVRYKSLLPEIIEASYKGTLLPKIFAMPKKTPLGFESAIRMARAQLTDALEARRHGHAPGDYDWYLENFVDWISSLGFHIELTGDEFDGHTPQYKLS